MRDDELDSRKFARQLRKEMTDAEVILWAHVRRNATGWRFRRQHPIGPFVADFVCVAAKLIIEVDGATHGSEAAARDAARTRYLEAAGWTVLRFGNMDIYRDLDGVWRKIVEVLGASPAPIPRLRRVLPPQAGEEN